MRLTPDYLLPDGAPRYGIRAHSDVSVDPARSADPATALREAAQLGSNHLSAAIASRFRQPWADRRDPLVIELRSAQPAAFAEAKALVKDQLGSAKKWRAQADKRFDAYREPVKARRRAAGVVRNATIQRAVLMLALIALPLYLAVTEAPLTTLALVGIAAVGAALLLGRAVSAHERIPDYPPLRLAWLEEIRQDVIDAALLAVLDREGHAVDARARAVCLRGWKHVRNVAEAVDRIS